MMLGHAINVTNKIAAVAQKNGLNLIRIEIFNSPVMDHYKLVVPFVEKQALIPKLVEYFKEFWTKLPTNVQCAHKLCNTKRYFYIVKNALAGR